jgi:uridine kinase
MTRIVAVDGHGGAGKTTFASRLAELLGGIQVAHTDDFASWDNPIDWWPRCIAELLEPLSRGEVARYEASAWNGIPRPAVEIRPEPVVILEGVTASREAFRPYLALSIWIDTPRALCAQRGIERDGESMREQWERWLASEDRYIARENPLAHVDIVVPGT